MSLFRAGNALTSAFVYSSSSTISSSSKLSVAAFHTSASWWAESQRQRAARLTRKANLEKKAERERIQQETKPHVVLGTRPGDDAKWTNCDLAKILVSPEGLAESVKFKPEKDREMDIPKYMSYGMEGTDAAGTKGDKIELFFHDLPRISSGSGEASHSANNMDRLRMGMGISQETRMVKETEFEKASNFARAIDLRNANARGLAFENRRRVIAAFSPSGNMADSGYPEVQVALLTMKIRNVWDHLMQRKKDISGRRALRMLVHQRAKLLKYIKRVDRDRYDVILQRVALEPEAVEGELIV